MYIKYDKNIHNLDNYYSVVSSENDPRINLIKESGSHLSLRFDNAKIRDSIIGEIWTKLSEKVICFDIDEKVEILKNSNKYNI